MRPHGPSRGFLLGAIALAVVFAADPGLAEEEGRSELPGYGWIGIDQVDALDPQARDAERLQALGDVRGILVRTRPIPWERIQPLAPISGRSLRDFSALDAFVAAWQRIGAEPVLVLSPEAAWAATSRESCDWARAVRERVPEHERELWLAQGTGVAPPLPARWDDWQRFVRDLVERYDADGEGDAAGVTRPVRWIQVLDRPASPTTWVGSAAEYQRALHHASLGAELASRRVRVAAGAVDVGRDAYEPRPDEEGLRRRCRERTQALPDGVAFAERRALDFDLETMAIPGIFAAVGHVGRANLRDEATGPSFLREHLARQGIAAEIWLVGSPLAKTDDPERDPTGRTSDEERRLRARWLATLRSPGVETYEAARAWFERGRAWDVARTAAAARSAGVARLFLGDGAGLDAWVPATKEGTWRARPGVRALAQVVALLSGHTRAEAVSLGRVATATTFRFPRGHARPWVVLVTLDPRHTWAGEPVEATPAWTAAVPLPDGRYVAATMEPDGGLREAEITVQGGLLPLALGPGPVFLWPVVR